MENGRLIQNNCGTPEWMLMDSGTTSHMTPNSVGVHSTEQCDVEVHLVDDSSVLANKKGIRSVHLANDDVDGTVDLSERLVAPNLGGRFLSVPATVRKNLGVIFILAVATMIDLDADKNFLRRTKQSEDGFFFVKDDEKSSSQV